MEIFFKLQKFDIINFILNFILNFKVNIMRLFMSILVLVLLSGSLFSRDYYVNKEMLQRKQSKILKNSIDRKDYAKIKNILNSGYDINASYIVDFKDDYYPKVINYAFGTSNVEIAKIFLKHTKLDKKELNILLRNAIVNSNFKIAKYMINNHIDINYTNKDDIYNLLQYALLFRRDKKTIKFLVENGADVNFIAISKSNLDRGDISTLLIASYNESIFDFLIKKGAKINGLNGYIALRNRVCSMDLKRILFLLNKNVNINFQDKNGKTILHWIANKTPENEIKELKELLNKKDPSWPSHYYLSLEGSIKNLENNYKNYDKVLKNILKLKPNLNLRNKNGKTPQDVAKENGNTKFLNAIASLLASQP